MSEAARRVGSHFGRRHLTVLVALASVLGFVGVQAALAAPILSVTPVTWDVVGLDSNNVTVGPNQFLVGARMCNTGDATATNLVATWNWDTANANINLSTPSTENVASLTVGACSDFYFTVAITRTSVAYNTVRGYHISFTATGGLSASTPTPRQVYVEKLISQNRNAVGTYAGPTSVTVGQQVTYTVSTSTATQGYEQLSAFSLFDSPIYHIDSVSSTYSSPSGGTNDTIYANACGWDPVPTSGTYRSCIGPAQYTGAKAGGTIVTTYVVTISSAGTSTLHTLINDFSGSSYHYNSDFDTSTFSVTATGAADLSVTKTDGSATYTPGSNSTYTVVYSNDGPSAADGATIADALPAQVSARAWTCVAVGGAVCPAASGSGALSTTAPTFPSGGSLTFTMVDAIGAGAGGDLADTATITAPAGVTDSTPGDNSATDTDTLTPLFDLSVTKTDGVTSVSPQDAVTYTIVVSNTGPSDVVAASVSDLTPAGLTGATWTCTVAIGEGACGAPSGIGDVATTLDLKAGKSATFMVSATVADGASGTISNTAVASMPIGTTDFAPGNNSATDSDSVTPKADLAISKSSTPHPFIAGGALRYTLTVSNNGPSAVTVAQLTDNVPAALTSTTWTCAIATGSGSCSAASGVGNTVTPTLDLASGAVATIVIDGTVNPGTTGSLSNTATIDPPVGTNDPTPANNSATDGNSSPTADLAVTKTSSPNPYAAGSALTYTATVTNNGPDNVAAAPFTDTVPAALSSVTWTCSVTGTGSCTAASGSGNAILTMVSLNNGAVATFTISGTVDAGATGTITNMASIATPPGVTDPALGNNSSLNVNAPSPLAADPAITITPAASSGQTGSNTDFIVTASNNGPDPASTIQALISIPAGFTFVSASGGGSWSCGASATLVTCTLTGPVASGASAAAINLTLTLPHTTGSATITASVTSSTTDSNAGNNNASADVASTAPAPLQPPAPDNADLSLTATASVASAATGDTISFTLTAYNNGPDKAANVVVTDTLPSSLTLVSMGGASAGWTCTASGNIVRCAIPSLSNAASSVIQLVTTAAHGGDVVNNASISSETADPVSLNNSAGVAVAIRGKTDLILRKTASSALYLPGKPLNFTITVSNGGPDDVVGARVKDLVPAALSGFSWTCTASNGSCTVASGSGPINQLVSLRTGGFVIFKLSGQVMNVGLPQMTNTATVSVPVGVIDADSANNSSSVTVRRGVIATKLNVTVGPGTTTLTSGKPTKFTLTTTNIGKARANGVTTCISLPAGLTVAKPAGGFLLNSRYCWSTKALDVGKKVVHVIFLKADSRMDGKVRLTASAVAGNARVFRDKANFRVLPAAGHLGGFTG